MLMLVRSAAGLIDDGPFHSSTKKRRVALRERLMKIPRDDMKKENPHFLLQKKKLEHDFQNEFVGSSVTCLP